MAALSRRPKRANTRDCNSASFASVNIPRSNRPPQYPHPPANFAPRIPMPPMPVLCRCRSSTVRLSRGLPIHIKNPPGGRHILGMDQIKDWRASRNARGGTPARGLNEGLQTEWCVPMRIINAFLNVFRQSAIIISCCWHFPLGPQPGAPLPASRAARRTAGISRSDHCLRT